MGPVFSDDSEIGVGLSSLGEAVLRDDEDGAARSSHSVPGVFRAPLNPVLNILQRGLKRELMLANTSMKLQPVSQMKPKYGLYRSHDYGLQLVVAPNVIQWMRTPVFRSWHLEPWTVMCVQPRVQEDSSDTTKSPHDYAAPIWVTDYSSRKSYHLVMALKRLKRREDLVVVSRLVDHGRLDTPNIIPHSTDTYRVKVQIVDSDIQDVVREGTRIAMVCPTNDAYALGKIEDAPEKRDHQYLVYVVFENDALADMFVHYVGTNRQPPMRVYAVNDSEVTDEQIQADVLQRMTETRDTPMVFAGVLHDFVLGGLEEDDSMLLSGRIVTLGATQLLMDANVWNENEWRLGDDILMVLEEMDGVEDAEMQFYLVTYVPYRCMEKLREKYRGDRVKRRRVGVCVGKLSQQQDNFKYCIGLVSMHMSQGRDGNIVLSEK